SASFLIVMAYTDREAGPYKGMSMFIVPTDTPGVEIVRNLELFDEGRHEGAHALIHYQDVRVPAERRRGEEGGAFAVAQTRLGRRRVPHASRTVGVAQRAFDMMCERALSRHTKGSLLAEKHAVLHAIADSYPQLLQF